MELERWVHPKENGEVQMLLVGSGQTGVTVGGIALRALPSERLESPALAFPICLARAGSGPTEEAPTTGQPAEAIVSFAPAIAHPPEGTPETAPGRLLLRFSELLSTWAGHCSQVGLRLCSMEEVEFGRIQVVLKTASDTAPDSANGCGIGPALALLAVAFEELAEQRDVATGAMRLESLSSPNLPNKGHWGAHLANEPDPTPSP